jgi:hypothetical protein
MGVETESLMQVVDPVALRKLNMRLSEPRFAQVKGFLLAIDEYTGRPINEMAEDTRSLLTLPRVKENANLVAVLREIGEYLDVANLDAAKAVVKRVLNPPAPVIQAKPGDRKQ